MGVRAAVVVVVVGMAVSVAAAPQDDITLTTGYQGVTVAISDQLDKSKCVQYVDSIKGMVAAASRLMFNATGGKVFFGDVVIVVPEQWACQGAQLQPSQMIYSYDSAHLRVGPSHYLFGDNPWTQQLGGCGEPGDWIYLPENFLVINTNDGNQENILVHEWAKYRWGVFEEYGHAHDAVFPSTYRDDNNTITPTYCSNHQLEGTMSCPGGTEAECQFTPNMTQNNMVTSSLLAVPFLDSVINFCDAANHNAAVPTKHNLLCDQSSAKEVMAWHADMMGNPVSLMDTNFTVVHAAADWPRMVLLVEYSVNMFLDQNGVVMGRWEQLRDNVRQFIKQEAAANSYVGVVVFGSRIVNASPILLLSQSGNRDKLAAVIPEDPPGPNEGKRDLYMAIQRGAQILDPQGGTLVLLTQNLEEYTYPQNPVDAAANNPVWPILYPSDISLSTVIFQQLADISPDTSVLIVQNDILSIPQFALQYQSVENSVDLHYNLLTAVASPATRVASNNCNKVNCTIPLEMKDSTAYISQAYVKVFGSVFEGYTQITVQEPNGRHITNYIKEGLTNWFFPVSTLQNGQYLVHVSFSISNIIVVAELWATPVPSNLQVSVWSPKGLHNLPYSPGLAPRLLAKVTNSASSPVLFADVTAQVANKNSPGTPKNIHLNDGGTGADVTGQDGVYSGYLVGFEPLLDVNVILTVTDNKGSARLVASSPRAAPTTPDNVACCGSKLDISKLQLQPTGTFTLSSPAVSGRLTGEPPGTYPPGRVTDLQASRSGYDVTLTFTAPGAQLDQGQAEWYVVNCSVAGENVYSNISGKLAGSPVDGGITLPGCDKVYTLSVVAYSNGLHGSTSNSVRETVPCNEQPPQHPLTAGAIAGITIGCILGVLLLVLIIYLCLNRDHLDDLWVWKMLTCRCCRCCKCCRNRKDDDMYNQPSQAKRSDVIRTNNRPSKPVRNLTDLYSRPNVETKREKHQGRPEDEDDGGFGDHQKRQNNMQMRAVEDVESLASSRSTLPINQVGLPIGGDNHAYDDGPYTIYRNAPPVPLPRANTQV